MEKIISSIELAIIAFRTNKVRTALAVLGIAIGISSIIIVFSAGEGIKGLLSESVKSFGTDIVEAEIKVPSSKTGIFSERQSVANLLQGVQITTMTLDDLDDVIKLPNITDRKSVV